MSGKFYAVAVGRRPGIYTSWTEAKAQTDGYPGAVHKSFKRREDAQRFLESHPEQVPNPEMSSKKVYAVAVGHHPGIYENWALAAPQVRGFPDAVHQSFRSKEEAESFLETYHHSQAMSLVASPLEEGHANDQRSGRSRSRSRATASLAGSQRSSIVSRGGAGHFYTHDTLIKTDHGIYKKAIELKEEDVVLDRHDDRTSVEQVRIYDGPRGFVHLQTKSGTTLEVTGSHRVVTLKGPNEEDRIASNLKPGDLVMVGATAEALTDVHLFQSDEPVVELQFANDAAVEALPRPRPGMITRGVEYYDDFRSRARYRIPGDRAQSDSPRARPVVATSSNDRSVWSRGTEKHPQNCNVCWPFHRRGECRSGVDCPNCHAPHPELPRRIRSSRGSGSHVSRSPS